MKQPFYTWAICLLTLFSLAACGGNGDGSTTGTGKSGTPKQVPETPTSGSITIAVDESFQPIIEAEIEAFEAIYEKAEVTANYGPESEVIASFLEGDVRLAIMARQLTEDENSILRKKAISPRETKIAVDAIALIVNNDNKCTYLTQDEVSKIVNGEINKWSGIDGAYKQEGQNDDIVVVFDHSGSSTARYIRENFVEGELPDNIYAQKTNPDVVKYVSETPGAMGVIGVNWVSDQDDSTAQDFLAQARVLKVQAPEDSEEYQEYFQPYQSYLALNYYPFTREVWISNREPRHGLGTGFASFVAGDKGQRVILKSGLLPATMPIRVVEFPAGQN